MTLEFAIEILGTAAFAISGALAASRKNMDIFGFCVMAMMPAVGGGTLRDLILDRPVFWVSNPWYVGVAVAAAIAVYFRHFKPGGRTRLLVWADALGLALFASLGTEISLEAGAGAPVAVMLGVATGVAGGMIRDVICNEIPLVLVGEIYATAAFASSVAFIAMTAVGVPRDMALAAGVLIGFGVRAAAIIWKLSLPSFRED